MTICLYRSWPQKKQFCIQQGISQEDPILLQFIHLPSIKIVILSASDMTDGTPWTRTKRPRVFIAPC